MHGWCVVSVRCDSDDVQSFRARAVLAGGDRLGCLVALRATFVLVESTMDVRSVGGGRR